MNNSDENKQFITDNTNNIKENTNMFTNNSNNVFVKDNLDDCIDNIVSFNDVVNENNSLNNININQAINSNFSVLPNNQIVNDNGSNTTNQVINSVQPVMILDNNLENDNSSVKTNQGMKDYAFTDGLDEVYDTKSIKGILTNKKFLIIVAILCFVFVSIVVAKAFYFGNKTRYYQEFFVEIESREEEYAKVYAGLQDTKDVTKKAAATEYIDCINSKIDVNNLSDGLNQVINEINNYYSESRNYFAFKYVDIYTGFSVSYNENQKIFSASSIKAPTDIYLWEMASQGKINLDDKLTYTSRYYSDGSGLLKSKSFNTSYTIRELLKLSTVNSDNAAHNMLMDRYGRENMLAFWQEKGTEAIFTARTNWGYNSAHDAAIYMQELYDFYVRDDEYGEAAMNNFLNTTTKFLTNDWDYKMANKIGWSGSAMHDVAIVFADNPYIVVALSNLGDKSYSGYFKKISELSSRLHKEYWQYKMDMCNNIKQY